MDILTQKRITDNGDGKGYFRNCVDYLYKEKPEPGEELVLIRSFGVSCYHPKHTYGHIIVNTVNYKNGKLYHSGWKELGDLAMYIHEITGNYCKPIIKKPDEK